MVYAIGAKMRPSCRCSVKIGRWAVMMISIEKSVGRPTSAAASATEFFERPDADARRARRGGRCSPRR